MSRHPFVINVKKGAIRRQTQPDRIAGRRCELTQLGRERMAAEFEFSQAVRAEISHRDDRSGCAVPLLLESALNKFGTNTERDFAVCTRQCRACPRRQRYAAAVDLGRAIA